MAYAVEAAFATSDSPAAFLNRMRAEPVRRVQYALALLRKKRIRLQWCDISKRIEHRSYPVLLELALLFADHPDEAAVPFWLRCATHMPEVVKEAEEVRDLITNAM